MRSSLPIFSLVACTFGVIANLGSFLIFCSVPLPLSSTHCLLLTFIENLQCAKFRAKSIVYVAWFSSSQSRMVGAIINIVLLNLYNNSVGQIALSSLYT